MDDRDLTIEAPAALPPKRRAVWLAPLLLAAIAFLLGAGALVYAIHRWDRLADLVHPRTMAAVPVAAVSAMPAAPVRVATTDPAIDDRVAKLETRIGEIDGRVAEASGDADRAEGLLVAFAARRALDRGQPVGFLEPMLRRHFGATEPQAVATVIGAGLRPVTLVQLEQRFDELAPGLRRPAKTESWWASARRELGTLIVIRKTDEPPAMPTDRLARADRALTLGRVDLALDEVARLPGAAAAADWMASARRYVLAHNALDRIETAALLAPDGAVASTMPGVATPPAADH